MKNLVLLLFLFPLAISLHAQWEPLGGPYGGSVYSILQNDKDYLFASTDNGPYRSTDRGQNWSKIYLPIPRDFYPGHLAVHNQYIISSWRSFQEEIWISKIFLSRDDGDSWEEILVPSTSYIDKIEFNSYGIYIQATDGIWVSNDLGESWKPSHVNTLSPQIWKMYEYDDHIYAMSSDTVYKSQTDADTWSYFIIDTLEDPDAFYAFDSIYFALSYYTSKLARSGDGGKTWKIHHNRDWDGSAFIKVGTDFYGHLNGRNMKSTDGGVSFFETGYNEAHFIQTFAAFGDTLFYGSALQGLYMSSDQGSTFNSLHHGINATSIKNIELTENSLWTTINSMGFSKMNLLTLVWDDLNHQADYAEDIISVDDKLFALKDLNQVIRSDDEGATWVEVISPLYYGSFSELYSDGVDLYAGGDEHWGELYKSVDHGSSWEEYSIDQNSSSQTFHFDGDAKYLTSPHFGIARSKNGGDWKIVRAVPDGRDFEKLTVSGQMMVLIEYQKSDRQYYILVSEDQGESWIEHIPDVPDDDHYRKGFTNVFVFDYFIIGYSTGSTFMHISFDKGVTWKIFDHGLPNTVISGFAIDDQYLYVGTWGHGVWKRKVEDVYTTSLKDQDPEKKDLKIYPNPNNGSFTIEIPGSENVSSLFWLTDQTGKKLMHRTIDSSTNIQINTSNLPQGIYFAFVSSANTIYTSKVLIMP